MQVAPVREAGVPGGPPDPLLIVVWAALLVGVAVVTVLLPAAGVALLVQWVFAQASRSRAGAFMFSAALVYGTVLVLVALGSWSVLWPGAAAVLLALAIGLAARASHDVAVQSIVRRNASLEQQGAMDGTTGTWSRAHILRLAERELARARRNDRPVSLMLIAVEGMDGAETALRDQALRCAAEGVKPVLRRQDAIGRLEDNRLLVLLSEANADDAWQAALRFQAACSGPVSGPGHGQIEISIGLASSGPDRMNLDTLIAMAERALQGARAARCHHRPAVMAQRAGA